jgi:hypothetical protein
MLPLIKFTIDTKQAEVSIYEAFNETMKNFYILDSIQIKKGEDLFFIDKLLYNWVSIMCDRRKTCEGVLAEGSWDECYFTTKFGNYDIKAMIVFKG